jgi:hypothetical protein
MQQTIYVRKFEYLGSGVPKEGTEVQLDVQNRSNLEQFLISIYSSALTHLRDWALAIKNIQTAHITKIHTDVNSNHDCITNKFRQGFQQGYIIMQVEQLLEQ